MADTTFRATANFECDNSCGAIIYVGEYVSLINRKLLCGGCAQDPTPTVSEERCKHELITNQCAECRPHPRGRYRDLDSPKKLTSIHARHPGKCDYCVDPIKVGDWISPDPHEKTWNHTDCIERDNE